MKWNFPIFAVAFLLLTGCNSLNTTDDKEEVNESNQLPPSMKEQTYSENNKGNESETETQQHLSPEEVINETEKLLTTDIPIKLPKRITVSSGYHLTAMTSSEQNQYTVMFLETEQPIPINNKELKNKEINLATIKATRYETTDQAVEQINHQNHSGNGAPSVDLGFGIKGFRDAGAGSQFIGWNEGRWSLAMRALTEQGNSIEEEVKKVVQYLEKNMLPIPHDVGSVKFDVSKTNGKQHIAWQEDDIVY
jgi:hypothetical protein